MSELLPHVENLLNEMRERAIQAKIPESEFDALLPKLKERKDEKLWRSTHRRLGKLRRTHFAEINRVWNLPGADPEAWENYDLFFDKPVLAEQKLLSKAQGKFRRMFRAIKETVDGTEELQGEQQAGSENPESDNRVSGG